MHSPMQKRVVLEVGGPEHTPPPPRFCTCTHFPDLSVVRGVLKAQVHYCDHA